MARGGARPNSGPRKGTKYRKRQPKADKLAEKMIKNQKKPKENQKGPDIESDDEIILKRGAKTPLQYMLDVMNDESKDGARRDRMAQAAAPYVHSRRGEKSSKKDDRNKRAKDASKGKFSPSAPPRLKAVKGGK
jgi:phage terminase small subunit